MYILLPSVRLTDYRRESAYEDVPRRAPFRVTLKVFAVLVVRDNHVVLILSFELVSFFYIYTVRTTNARDSLSVHSTSCG